MSQLRILLVDDETDFLVMMKTRLESWGQIVTLASNGREAISIIEKCLVDVVILDYMMPQMDGVATLAKIRKINQEIPVIMFTAYPTSHVISGTEKLKVTAFVPKLSDYSDVQDSLKTALSLAENKINNQKG